MREERGRANTGHLCVSFLVRSNQPARKKLLFPSVISADTCFHAVNERHCAGRRYLNYSLITSECDACFALGRQKTRLKNSFLGRDFQISILKLLPFEYRATALCHL
jgi:hypothetical protein